MKALEIAKKIDEYVRDYGCSNGTINLLDDLIDELEALENRSCDNCKNAIKLHNDINVKHSEFCCRIDSRYNNKDFYCNRWESK